MNVKKKYDAIVIGAGLGGLTAGARLAKKGRKVLILEQHYIPGGCATTFKRKDFVMEVGLHEMDGLDNKDIKTAVFEELGIFDGIELIAVPEFYRTIEEKEGGIDFILPDNVETAKKRLIEKFPSEKKGINKYFWFITGMRDNILKYGKLKKWQRQVFFLLIPVFFPFLALASSPLLTILSHTNPLFWIFRSWKFAFWHYYNVGDYLDAIIKDERLKTILIANLSYYHDDPYSMNLTYFSAAQGGYMEGGGWYIKGGSQKLSNYLAQFIEDHSGTVLLGKRVTEILCEKGSAVGVTYQNAFDLQSPNHTVNANLVIGNAPIPNIANMLTGKEQLLLKNHIKNLKPSISLLSVYVGFNANIAAKYKNKAYSTFIVRAASSTKGYKKEFNLDFNQRGFVFVDYSKIDAHLTTQDKSVGAMCTISYLHEWENMSEADYKAKKDYVAQCFIERLDKLLPGIAEDVAYYEVGTPRTIQSYILSPEGTPYGYAQTLKQSPDNRPQLEAPVKNLYFSSAWTFPGGGFTGAIISGILSSKLMLSKHPKAKHLDPAELPDTQTAALIERNEIARDTIELVFEKPKDFENFQAGQYAVVSLEAPKFNKLDMPLRPLSIASHPSENVLRFAMRTSDSAFKKSCMAMKKGELAKIYGPKGDFTLKDNDRDIVFLIAGIGITPVLSMLKDLEAQKSKKKVTLLYSNKFIEDIAYHEELKNIKLRKYNYTYHLCLSQMDGRMDTEFLEKQLNDFKAYDYYMVGMSPFLKSMKDILQSKAVPETQMHIDDFG
ncbi:MAG: FAD-dependent oxidoreductase [Flavobacteriaceae bacterium]|jgi:all-trans-retinol 13,14-reductase